MSYILVAISVVSLVSLAANFLLERQFREYVKERQEERNRQTVTLISQQYLGEGQWKQSTVEQIGINALEQGIIVKLTDAAGKVIWDATLHNHGLCQQMLSHMARNMASRYANWNGGYTVTRYPATLANQVIGRVELGYYGPYFYSDTDLAFINTLNRILLGITVFTLLISLALGIAMARSLSTPLAKVIQTTGRIAEGHYDGRVEEKTDIKEVHQLTTSINELAASLQKQELLRKRLTADVAHELRTPLATVQSHLEAMIDGIWPASQSRLESCHEEILRINRMVRELYKLAQFDGEAMQLDRVEFDLSELLKRVVLNFEGQFQAKKVQLQYEAQPVLIRADRDKLSQVIVNLLANGLKYTTPGGSVRLGIVTEQNGVAIRIRDTGIGIAPEDLPFIFERFYRADKSRNRLSGGSGIGLAIVKAIVEAHEGKVTAESELGKGTEVKVWLPTGI